jgi:hypothetical protein
MYTVLTCVGQGWRKHSESMSGWLLRLVLSSIFARELYIYGTIITSPGSINRTGLKNHFGAS